MPSLTDPQSVVKRAPSAAGLKAMEAAAFVRAAAAGRGLQPADLDDVFQEAALWALQWNADYGAEARGNPFNPMVAVAFRRTKISIRQAQHAVSVTSDAVRKNKTIGPDVPIVGCGHGDEFEDGQRVAVDVADEDALGPDLLLAGEEERFANVQRVVGRLGTKEQLLARSALSAKDGSIRALAKRCKVSVSKARAVLRRLVAAVGHDPSVAHLRRFARDERLPAIGTVLRREAGGRLVECRVGLDTFHYAGESYPSLSAAARAASRSLGLFSDAVNGYVFWRLAERPRVLSPAWNRRPRNASRRTCAAGSRKRKRSPRCTASVTSPQRKEPKRSAAQRAASTSASRTPARSRR